MELKIGTKIAELRKAKGMTQEQLAAALGISSPAVSKWETDHSYPDITLLCPLARALGTDVDTLLAYEEQPSEEQITEWFNEIIELSRTQELSQAEEKLDTLLHKYPSSAAVKYYAVAVLSTFEMFCPACSDEKKEIWKEQKKEYLEAIYESGPSCYWQSAVSSLASIAIAEDELEKAEALLKEFPEYNNDPTVLWSLLYLKRNEQEKAREMTQKRLYVMI